MIVKTLENIVKMKKKGKRKEKIRSLDNAESPPPALEGSARVREYQRPMFKTNIYFESGPLLLDPVIRAINGSKQSEVPPVRLGKSRIAGFGLFTNRFFLANTTIIEYIGEIIGQVMADRRERLYSLLPLRRQDCYLFRLAADRIIDSTVEANLARFINHSCSPNCESRIERNCIMIYALRDIAAGEELTYDYKFSRETADDKAPCRCGANKCRGYMN